MSTILIIDDNPANLKILLKYLQQAQFKVMVAENGEVGLERARLIQPDLILLDVVMPGLDGFAVCRLLKYHQSTQHIPIIFMTSLTDTTDKVRGFEAGGVDFITKPIEEQEVLVRVTTHLTLRRLQQDLERLVQERTANLEAEIERREKSEAEKDDLLAIIRSQNEQLFKFNEVLLTERPQLLPQQSLDPRTALSPRQLEVLHFLAKGYSSREIAQKLHLTVGSVSSYRTRIMQKLKVKTFTELLKLAADYELVGT